MSSDETISINELLKRVEYLERKTGYKYSPPDPNVISNTDYLTEKLSFEELLLSVDDRSLQRVFREISDDILSGALYSLQTPELVNKIKRNVSIGHFERIMDNIKDGCLSSRPEDLLRYRSDFTKVVWQLEEMGEIVLSTVEGELVGFNDGPTITDEELKKKQQERKEWWDKYVEESKNRWSNEKKKIEEWIKKVGLKNE